MDTPFMAILEVCDFNDWLIEVLRKCNCREIVLIHLEKPLKKKTDRRDAHKLADLLWLNRERLAAGQLVHGLRRVYLVTQKEREDRQLTALRKTLGQRRTRTSNKIHRIINRHNLAQMMRDGQSLAMVLADRLKRFLPNNWLEDHPDARLEINRRSA